MSSLLQVWDKAKMDQSKRSAIEAEARESELDDFKAQNELLKRQVRELKAEIARDRRRRAARKCSVQL